MFYVDAVCEDWIESSGNYVRIIALFCLLLAIVESCALDAFVPRSVWRGTGREQPKTIGLMSLDQSLTSSIVNCICDFKHQTFCCQSSLSFHEVTRPHHLESQSFSSPHITQEEKEETQSLSQPTHDYHTTTRTSPIETEATMFTGPLTRSLRIRTSSMAAAAVRRQQPFHPSPFHPARKDAMDKDSMKTESNEYSKSSSDDQAAAVDDAAFNPDKTSPEEAHDAAGKQGEEKGVSFSSYFSSFPSASRVGVLEERLWADNVRRSTTRSTSARRTTRSVSRGVSRRVDLSLIHISEPTRPY